MIEIDDVIILKSEEPKTQQIDPAFEQLDVVTPRYSFEDIFSYYDVNTWHKRCILLKAGVAVNLGWNLVTDDDNKEPDAEYGEIMEVLDRTKAEMGYDFQELAYRVAIDYYNCGNGFTEIIRDNRAKLGYILHVPGKTVRRHKNMDAYWQVRNGIERFFWEFNKKLHPGHKHGERFGANNEIAQCLNYDPNSDYYGMAEWIPALAAIALDRSAVSYNAYMFENEMIAKILMIIRGADISKEARQKIQAFLAGKFVGVANSGRAAIIPIKEQGVEVDVHKLQADEKDIAYIKGRQFTRDEIVTAHGTPPRLLGIVTAGQLGATGELEGQLKIFKNVLIDPDKRRFENFFNHIIRTGLDAKKWRIEFNELDITTAMDDAQYLTAVAPWLSDDEAREILGYKPRDNEKQTIEKMDKASQFVEALVDLRKELQKNVE